MNTITSSIGQALAMDGQNYFKVAPQILGSGTTTAGVARSVPGGAEVAQNIAQNTGKRTAAPAAVRYGDRSPFPALQRQ